MSTVIQASTEIDLEDAAVARKEPKTKDSDRKLVAQLVDQARAEGVELVGENGLLGRLTKLVLESALEGEITDHLGNDKHQRSGSETTNSRNGARSKTVITDVGPVEISVHVNVRLEEHKLCLLVMIGVRADGRKELIALTDGYRESAESWADLLRDCKRRGMRAPVLAVGDGALGFWGALREVFPQTSEQRCWFHKIANCLGALPKSAHPGAKKHLAEIWNAEDKAHALRAVKEFEAAYGVKHPKAVAKILDDLDELLAFYDFPAEHWVHLRTTNPIESTFATVRHRTKVTKGPGSRAAGLAMAFKLIESAQTRWRAVNAPHLVALVRAGARFERGVLVEREQVTAA